MADLLECLIQIKGLAGTPARVSSRALSAAGRGCAAEALYVASALCAAEVRFGECLSIMLEADQSALPPLEREDRAQADAGPADDLERCLAEFAHRRGRTVEVLDRCSADELGRVGVLPSGRRLTVADLVAVMLAHDTDQVGRLLG